MIDIDLEAIAEDGVVCQRIVDDMVFRLDALATRRGHDINAMRAVALSALALSILQNGACRGRLLAELADDLKGECPCEMKTEGSA